MSKEHQEYDLTANIQDVLNVLQTPGDIGEDTEPGDEALETIHVYPVEGGGILFTRTPIEEDQGLDTTPIVTPQPSQPTSNAAIGVWFFGLFMILSCLMFQLYVLINPFTVTVTILSKSQQLTANGTLQLGRVLNPITISQSQTVATTGKGHQDAKQATGELIFYNGQSTEQTIAIGTIFTGADGIQVATDQAAIIPPASPPQFGEMAVSAHAINSGSAGNIPAGDINTTVAIAVFAKNTAPFHGGQDERDFQTVAKSNITTAEAPLKATLAQSVNGALQGQLKDNESLVTPSCTTTTSSDHRPGDEATQVKITASETCSAVAYNRDELQAQVIELLNHQETEKLGSGYSILGNPQITVTSTTTAKQVTLSFTSVSAWVYALNLQEQKYIKKIIAGKNKQNALLLLSSLPGIESISIQSSGFGDDTRIPKDVSHIHLLVIYAAGVV